MSRAVIVFIGILVTGYGSLFAGDVVVETKSPGNFQLEPTAYKAMRMTWWRQSKLGLLIDCGLEVSLPQSGDSNALSNPYDAAAKRFNPQGFVAAEWVDAAKRAGMKYLIAAGKTSDGFCLFDSAQTEFDVTDASPFKRDMLKELSEECRRQGLKFGVYYSILDQHHPDYPHRRTNDVNDAEIARYLAYVKAQLQELVTQYDPAVLWFGDRTEPIWTVERWQDLSCYLRGLKPDIVIGIPAASVGTDDPNAMAGDFAVVSSRRRTKPEMDWQACVPIRDIYTGAYRSGKDMLCESIEMVSYGGNGLLRVRLSADGELPVEVHRRLRDIGLWMRVGGKSIYDVLAGPFGYLPFGCSTAKNNRIYIHILDWPRDGRIVLPGLISNPISATFLKDPNVPVGITLEQMDVALAVPEGALDPLAATIELEFKDVPEILYGPEIFPETTEFTAPIDITFSEFVADNSCKIYYTLNGSDPNTSSLYYEEPFTLRDSAMISCQKIAPDGTPLSPISRKNFIRKPQPQERNKPQ